MSTTPTRSSLPAVAGKDEATFGSLTTPAQVEIQGPTPGARDRGLLIEMSGAEAGRVHRIEAEVTTIGRAADCTLSFPDATLSRVHARVVRLGADHVLEDAGSLNGTWVNGERVQRRVLAHGDRVRLGSGLRLQFQFASPQEEAVLCRLYEAGVRDGLTGAYNRRHLEERLGAEVAFALRHGTELAVLLFDLDHFKRVNDTYGHLAGDEVLKAAAIRVASEIRREDLLARYGGEEFVVVARGVRAEAAARLAERVRRSIESMKVPFEGTDLEVTASIGVATLAACLPDPTPARLLALADERLYRAKTAGRNRVVAEP